MSDTNQNQRLESAHQESRPIETATPVGIRRCDANGRPMIDTLAGRASIFGFGFEPITNAIQAVAEEYLGDASAFDPATDAGKESTEGNTTESQFVEPLHQILGDSPNISADSILFSASADEAVDRAICLARRSGRQSAFRSIAFVGSDHGRTGMCRTASGQIDLASGFGPMMAGFHHVPLGDLDAVRKTIDDQTVCLLLSPIDFANGARPVDASFLVGLRELCDQQHLLLVIDETQVVFGASGKPFSFASIADIQADMVILSAGLFGGLPGGLIIASERVIGEVVIDTSRLPLQAAIATATLLSMKQQHLPESAIDSTQEFAVELAETLGGFEFIRDLQVSGMTLGVETDVESSLLIKAARTVGMRIDAAGETAFRMQLPLVIGDDDRHRILETLTLAMESVKRETASLGV